MALTTYSGLLSGLATLSVRTDLTAVWPTYVELAHAQIDRDLADGVRPMIARATTDVDEEFESVPTDMARPVSFILTVDDTTVQLQHVAPENLARMKQTPEAYRVLDETGTEVDAPGWYAVVGEEFQFFPAPETSRSGELTYVQRLPALSAENTTNWLLTAHPDAYLYGALVQFAMTTQDERLGAWSQAYQAALAGVKAAYPTETNKVQLRTEFPFPRYY